MYTLSIFLIGGGQPIALQFKDEMGGLAAKAALHDARIGGRTDGTPEEVVIKDDYGREVEVLMEEIAGWQCGDLAKSFEGQVDATMIQTRAQIDAQQRAAADPKLRLAATTQGNLIVPGRQQ